MPRRSAELKEAESKINFFDAQYARQNQLKQRGVGFAFRFEEADSNAAAARDRVGVLQQKIERILASCRAIRICRPSSIRWCARRWPCATAPSSSSTAPPWSAPVGGIAVNVKLLPGEQVKAATPLFAIVSDTRPWVEANFKETELTHVRPGQHATVVLDIYPDVTWQAEVESISPATGAEFALLPPQNASGNWVKVVQRLPVRLRLLPRPNELPLRAGMTATVKVDTQRERRITQIFGGSAAATSQP